MSGVKCSSVCTIQYRQIFPVLVVNGWVVSTAAVGAKYNRYFWYVHTTRDSFLDGLVLVGDGW